MPHLWRVLAGKQHSVRLRSNESFQTLRFSAASSISEQWPGNCHFRARTLRLEFAETKDLPKLTATCLL